MSASEQEPVVASNPPQTTDMPKDLRIPAALARTAMSSEQTLMAWVRTALSMFTFGFSITQFFFYLDERQEGLTLSTGPRRLGIALIVLGILGLTLSSVEHVMRTRQMKEQGLPDDAHSNLPIASAIALLLVGLAALISVTLNWSL